MNLVDDATGTTLCRMGEEETIWAAVGVLRAWIERYGVPQVLYTDSKNVYVPGPSEECDSRERLRRHSLGACVGAWGFVLSRLIPRRRRLTRLVKGFPSPERVPRPFRIPKISLSVRLSISWSISATTCAGVILSSQAVNGLGRVSVWVAPPLNRT